MPPGAIDSSLVGAAQPLCSSSYDNNNFTVRLPPDLLARAETKAISLGLDRHDFSTYRRHGRQPASDDVRRLVRSVFGRAARIGH